MFYRDVILRDLPISYWKLGEGQPGPPTIVQTAPVGHTTTGTTVSATFANVPASTSTLIAVVCLEGGSTVTGSTLAWVVDTVTTEGSTTAVLSVLSDGSTTAFTFQDTGGSSGENWVVLMEVAGLATSPKDHTATPLDSSSATSWAASMVANTNPNALEIFTVGLDTFNTDPSGPTFSNGFTVSNHLSVIGSGTAISLLLGTKIVSVNDTPSSTIAWTGSTFSAGVGVSYKGQAALSPDVINGKNNLTPVGGITRSYGGAVASEDGGGGAVLLDGSTGYLNNSSPTGMPSGGAACTMEAWIRPNSTMSTTGAGGCILAFGKATASTGSRTLLMANIAGTVYLFTDSINAGNNITLVAAQFPIPGRWNHIVISMSSSVLVYALNGTVIATFNFGTGLNTDASTLVRIGNRVDASAPLPFVGAIDEVAIYNYNMSAGQIAAHFQAGQRMYRQGTDWRRRRR